MPLVTNIRTVLKFTHSFVFDDKNDDIEDYGYQCKYILVIHIMFRKNQYYG